MQCSRCHHDNAPDAKFCGACGGRLESACPACSRPNPPGNKFCQECGTALVAPAGGDTRFPSPDAYTPMHLARKILTARSSLARPSSSMLSSAPPGPSITSAPT